MKKYITLGRLQFAFVFIMMFAGVKSCMNSERELSVALDTAMDVVYQRAYMQGWVDSLDGKNPNNKRP